MPTENRSSNTELSKIVTEALVGMVSGVTGMKPPPGEALPGFIQAPIDRAVTRISGFVTQPAPQPHPEPIAWMVGTAFWWTKEEAERDAAATGLPIVGLGPMTGATPAEQHQGDLAVQKPPKSECPNCLGDRMFGCFECQPDDLSGDEEKQMQSAPYGWHVEWADSGDHYLFTKVEKRIEVLRLDSDVKVVPLYTHAEPSEVEDLLASTSLEFGERLDAVEKERDALCAQLADRDALLREVRETLQKEYWDQYAGLDETRDLIDAALSANAEPSEPVECAICRDLGNQCMECEEGEFREWADRHFAAADYRKTDAGVFIQDWIRHAYGAWCARGALVRQS